MYRGADKSLARPGRKQARKHVRVARDFNKIETWAVIKFLFLQGKAPNEIHVILTEKFACLLPGRAKNLSAPLYMSRAFFKTFSCTYLVNAEIIDTTYAALHVKRLVIFVLFYQNFKTFTRF